MTRKTAIYLKFEQESNLRDLMRTSYHKDNFWTDIDFAKYATEQLGFPITPAMINNRRVELGFPGRKVFLTSEQQETLNNFIREKFTKSRKTDKIFAEFATKQLGFTVRDNVICKARKELGIPNNYRHKVDQKGDTEKATTQNISKPTTVVRDPLDLSKFKPTSMNTENHKSLSERFGDMEIKVDKLIALTTPTPVAKSILERLENIEHALELIVVAFDLKK